MTIVLAAVGSKVLWLLYIWLASAIVCSWLSEQKGYGEKAGLGTGLLLSVIGVIIWVFVPAKPNSPWKQRKQRAEAAKG